MVRFVHQRILAFGHQAAPTACCDILAGIDFIALLKFRDTGTSQPGTFQSIGFPKQYGLL